MNLWTKAIRKISMSEPNNVKSLKEKPDSYFQYNKNVRVINNLEYVKRMENKFGGGWTDEMEQCLNQICTVIMVDPDKLIHVKTGSGKLWFFKRESLESVDGEDEDTPVDKVRSKPINQADLFKAIDEGTLIDLNPNISTNILNKRNREGMTPLFYACFIGKHDIALWLCEKGADPKIPDKSGDLPIHNCALNRNYRLLSYLIDRYPSTVNSTRRNGDTLLDIAKYLVDETIENMIKTKRTKSLSQRKIDENLTFETVDSKRFNTESITSSTNEIIQDPPKTLNPPKISIIPSPKPQIDDGIYNSGSLNLLYPPKDESSKIFENLKFENVNKKQLPSESISIAADFCEN